MEVDFGLFMISLVAAALPPTYLEVAFAWLLAAGRRILPCSVVGMGERGQHAGRRTTDYRDAICPTTGPVLVTFLGR